MKPLPPSLITWEYYEDGKIIQVDPLTNAPLKVIQEATPQEEIKPTTKQLSCKRCGATWTPRKKKRPIQCPKCKSPYWNKERVKRK
jgi:predicted Zn-ribbon and HTH transcriptional regulator